MYPVLNREPGRDMFSPLWAQGLGPGPVPFKCASGSTTEKLLEGFKIGNLGRLLYRHKLEFLGGAQKFDFTWMLRLIL